ncbi:MAG: YIP1 family protein [Defluviitaleaceae bacterium]|nr:YIP1 family protein [Defluviitaleaceae bacterium]
MSAVKRFFKLYSLPMYILVRPFAGFYAMKFEEKGTIKLALFNFLLLCLAYGFSNQYTAILADDRHPYMINSLFTALYMAATLLLFCVANWSVTSITGGEGRFKDILMAICYAMTPLVLTVFTATIISNFLTADEMGLHTLMISAGFFYFILLCFIGLLTVHNYGAVKALLMILMTFVAILIIVFLGALLFTLWTQLGSFISNLYTELVFRF